MVYVHWMFLVMTTITRYAYIIAMLTTGMLAAGPIGHASIHAQAPPLSSDATMPPSLTGITPAVNPFSAAMVRAK